LADRFPLRQVTCVGFYILATHFVRRYYAAEYR